MRFLSALLFLLTVTSIVGRARGAEMTPSPNATQSVVRPLEIGGGGDALVVFAPTCRTEGDTEGCQPGAGWAGFHVAPRWRLSSLGSVGLNGAIGWRPSSMGTMSSDGSRTAFSQRIIRLSGEGRLYWPGEGTQAFGIFEAGLALAQDGITYYGPFGTDERSVRATQAAPFAALGLGIDFQLSPLFALGVDGRAIGFAFGGNPPALGSDGQRATKYGPQLGLTVAVNATLRLPI